MYFLLKQPEGSLPGQLSVRNEFMIIACFTWFIVYIVYHNLYCMSYIVYHILYIIYFQDFRYGQPIQMPFSGEYYLSQYQYS